MSEIENRWAAVVQLTNDEGSETKITVGCRTLNDDWKTINHDEGNWPTAIGTLFRIPISIAETVLFGLEYAIYGCP